MRIHRKEVCESAQKGRQVTKGGNPQATPGIIRTRRQNSSVGVVGPLTAAGLKPKQEAQQQHPSKGRCKGSYEDFPTDSLQQINFESELYSGQFCRDTSCPQGASAFGECLAKVVEYPDAVPS